MSAAASPARDPLYGREAQRAFCARLRDFGYDYGDVAEALERIGLPRPSAGTGAWRALLISAARTRQRDDAHELADQVAALYRPAAHLWLPLAPDADGYLAALLDAAPDVCAAAEWRDITICDGRRVFWPVVSCRWPSMDGAGDCADPTDNTLSIGG